MLTGQTQQPRGISLIQAKAGAPRDHFVALRSVFAAFEIGEEHRDLLALAFQGGARVEDLLGQMGGGEGLKPWRGPGERRRVRGARAPRGSPRTFRRTRSRVDSRSHSAGSVG